MLFAQENSEGESAKLVKKFLQEQVDNYFKSEAFNKEDAKIYNKVKKSSPSQADSIARKVSRNIYKHAADHVYGLEEESREKFLNETGSSEREIYKVMQELMRDPKIKESVVGHLTELGAENLPVKKKK
jgi:hypothetical protein